MGDIGEFWRQTIEKISSLPVSTDPYAHISTYDTVPAPLYDQMTTNLPETEAYVFPCDYKQVSFGCEDPRCVIDFDSGVGVKNFSVDQRAFWDELTSKENSMLLTNCLIEKFKPYLDFSAVAGSADKKISLLPKWMLARSLPGFELPPHEDINQKLVAALFYLPTEERETGYGTIMLRPKGTEIREHPTNGERYHPDDFEDAGGMEFRRNGFFAFARTPYSFHRVGRLPENTPKRDVLMFNIMFAGL